MCENCNTGLKRINLDIKITQSELNNIKLITNKLSCCKQAASPASIPDEIDPAKGTLFVKAALDALGEVQTLNDYWWEHIKQEYELPVDKNIWVDFTTGELYTME